MFEPCAALLPSDPATQVILKAMQKETPIRRLSLMFEPYLDQLGLGEKLMEVIPIRRMEDIHLNGNVDPGMIRRIPVGRYPIETFAVSDNADKIAMTFDRSYFEEGDERRENHVFLAQVDAAHSTLRHIAEIILPLDVSVHQVTFAEKDRTLIIEGSRSKDNGRIADLFFYDITQTKPKALRSLSERVSRKFTSLAQLGSPDQSIFAYAAELEAKKGEPNFMALSVDRTTLNPKVLALGSVGFADLQGVQCMEYDDDRRGYLIMADGGVQLTSCYMKVSVSTMRGVQAQRFERPRGAHRSSHSAWLIHETSAQGNQLTIRNELSGKVDTFTVPELDYGQIAEVKGGYLYSERNHPHYRSFFISSDGQVREMTKGRLIHQDVHSRFFAGATSSKQSEVTIEIIPF